MRTRTYGDHTETWLDERFDLRRKHEASLSDSLVRRAHWLDPKDRELVLAMFRDGRSALSIARLLEQDPRMVRRRLKRLARRLQDPRVAYVVAHQAQWAPGRRRVARRLYIAGLSMREVASELGVSLHCVRKHRDAIEAMWLGARHHASAPASPSPSPSRRWRDAPAGERS